MNLQVYAVLFALTLGVSYVALTRKADERITGLFATILWGILAFHSLRITHTTPCCRIIESYYSLAVLSMAAAVIMLTYALAALLGYLPNLESTRYGGDTV